MVKLNNQTIYEHLEPNAKHIFKPIQIFEDINSTNTYLLDYSKEYFEPRQITVALAEHQTAGHGREGRKWEAASGQSILMSLLWQIPEAKNQQSSFNNFLGLSLSLGMAVVDALEKFGINALQVKWPNDIYYQKKKLGGILIETRYDSKTKLHNFVIGVGINVTMPDTLRQTINKKIVTLEEILQQQNNAPHEIDRNQIVALILNEFHETLTTFLSEGFGPFYSRWPKYDALSGQKIEHFGLGYGMQDAGGRGRVASRRHGLNQNDKLTFGTGVGISQTGALLLRTESGQVLEFLSGSAEFDNHHS